MENTAAEEKMFLSKAAVSMITVNYAGSNLSELLRLPNSSVGVGTRTLYRRNSSQRQAWAQHAPAAHMAPRQNESTFN